MLESAFFPQQDFWAQPSNVNPEIVTLRMGHMKDSEVSAQLKIFMTPTQARTMAAVLLADADRCDAYNGAR